MTKTVSLNTWQRIWLNSFVGSQNGTASTMRKWIRIINAVEISDTLASQIGLHGTPDGIAWDNKKAAENEPFEIVLDNNDYALLVEALRKAINQVEFQATNAKNVISMFEAFGLGAELEDTAPTA